MNTISLPRLVTRFLFAILISLFFLVFGILHLDSDHVRAQSGGFPLNTVLVAIEEIFEESTDDFVTIKTNESESGDSLGVQFYVPRDDVTGQQSELHRLYSSSLTDHMDSPVSSEGYPLYVHELLLGRPFTSDMPGTDPIRRFRHSPPPPASSNGDHATVNGNIELLDYWSLNKSAAATGLWRPRRVGAWRLMRGGLDE